jgi:prephenate dehydrogenase/3-phosphoshikimate 1-carboxyvinyltransferase
MGRPMERVAAPLRAMGAQIRTHDGHPPVEIGDAGELRAISYTLPVASAQVKSALLLAALGATGELSLTEPAASRDHTERMLGAFGVRLARQ